MANVDELRKLVERDDWYQAWNPTITKSILELDDRIKALENQQHGPRLDTLRPKGK